MKSKECNFINGAATCNMNLHQLAQGGKFESELSNLIGGSYMNSSKLDSCMTLGGKNETN